MQIVLHREIDVGDGLRLHALGCVDDEKRPVARREGAADFIGEVDVSRSVDEVEFVFDAVVRFVEHPHGVRFDRDAAFLFEVHRIEELIMGQVALFDRSGRFEQSVGKRGFPVVDMSDDRKVSDMFEVGHLFCSPFLFIR